MTNPPLSVDPEGLKPETRGTGSRWVDLLIAAAAIILSLVSLSVAVENARTQEKMVAAASRPILFYITGNRNGENEPVITMTIRNVGVGPAFLKHLEVRHRGVPVKGGHHLVRTCCFNEQDHKKGPDTGWLGMGTQRVGQTVMPAADDTRMLTLRRTPENAAVWDRLNKVRFELTFDACYCSVLGECWRSDLSGLEPRTVDKCPSEGGYRE